MRRSEFGAKALMALATGKTMVLHIRGFIDASTCGLLAQRAEAHGYAPYLNVPSVRRIGMAFYETEGKPELVERYFASAHQNIADFRRACLPFSSPIDTLRCMLDEAWPAGAHLQTLGGRKMFIGLSRCVEPGTTFLAHHDIFADDAPGHSEATSLIAQFGANIYIQMPSAGGALLMWNDEIPPMVFNRMRGSDYGIPIDRLGPPAVSVRPSPGDLLVFNSRKMHAVSPGSGRSRLAVSCFVGYRGESKPLTYWS
jgi:hypothetical protein